MCIRDRAGADRRAVQRQRVEVADERVRRQHRQRREQRVRCLLYTSDAADERSSVDLGGRRIIKKKNETQLMTLAASRMQYTIHVVSTQ